MARANNVKMHLVFLLVMNFGAKIKFLFILFSFQRCKYSFCVFVHWLDPKWLNAVHGIRLFISFVAIKAYFDVGFQGNERKNKFNKVT